ncbi:unnamed protein product, partial [Mesorhabditis spiculigera]
MRLETLILAIGMLAVTTAFPGDRRARRPRWGNMTTDQVAEFKKSLRRTNVDRFHSALERLRESARGSQSDSEIKKYNERIKKIGQRTLSESARKLEKDLVEVNADLGVAENLYGGDMVLTDSLTVDARWFPEAIRGKRQAVKGSKLWANNTVYYQFDSSLPADAQTGARLAIAFWGNMTCVDFVESATAKNRIRFYEGSGCWSGLGMVGGVQDLSLGYGCHSFRTAAHEIGHALGFQHTHSREDRDTAISVLPANIDNGWAPSFEKAAAGTIYNYGMPYDYGSVMHYGPYDVSWNKQPTMVAKVAPYQENMGSAVVSFYDVSMMNEHYSCKAKCTCGATCCNGGFRNSRNCNTCICPYGWAGPTCNQRSPGCGADLTATATTQEQVMSVGKADWVLMPSFATCVYHIKAPAGMKVELTMNNLVNVQCINGCYFTGIEVKATKDHRYTGIRSCCGEDNGKTIVSEGNIVPVIIFSRLGTFGVTLRYKAVSAATASTVVASQIADSRPTY